MKRKERYKLVEQLRREVEEGLYDWEEAFDRLAEAFLLQGGD